mmetsp:Transcript_17469/g.37761  ORF Transcript_17469/g.37761 Transcript_17469/m.37761 type:complete len:226 (-) Transcript_17469:238-915(-)
MSSHPDGQNLRPSLKQIPPFFIHSFDFLRHFVLFFLLPIVTVVFCALVAAALTRTLHRLLFARYATPDELLENALNRLKKNEHSSRALHRSSSASRKKALDTLRLVIQLQPDIMKPYIVLATELFYGDLNNDESVESNRGQQRKRKTNNSTTLRRREVQSTEESQHNPSPTLIECEEIIKQGLSVDPKNDSLLKLQNELQIVTQYGRNGAHAKMMNIGSLGWMRG